MANLPSYMFVCVPGNLWACARGCSPGLCHLSGTKQGHFPQGEGSDDLSRVISRLISALLQNWRKHLFHGVSQLPGWSWELPARAGCGGNPSMNFVGRLCRQKWHFSPCSLWCRDRIWMFLNSFNSSGVLTTSSALFGGSVFLLGVLEFAWTLGNSHCEKLAPFWGSSCYFLTTVNCWKLLK